MNAVLHGTARHLVVDRRLRGLPEWMTASRGIDAAAPVLLTPGYGSLRRAFSGTSWYLARAGIASGVLDGAFTLHDEDRFDPGLWPRAALWKLGRRVRGLKAGGFKFERGFQDALWSRDIGRFAGATIVSNTQIVGPAYWREAAPLGIRTCFYIDGTLTEYFGQYGQVGEMTIGPDSVARAIAIEREGYARADRVFTMSALTARDLTETYGVAPDRITVVTPGANIDDADVPAPSRHVGWFGPEFTLGFVGLFPHRKGLDRIADAVRILRGRGRPIRLVVIGVCPEAIAAMDGVTYLGRLDKRTDPATFVDAIRRVDLGCQMSRAELLGIAVIEFLRLGVPVLATRVGGIAEVLEQGGGVLVPPDAGTERVVAELETLMTDPARYARLRADAVSRAAWASWSRATGELARGLPARAAASTPPSGPHPMPDTGPGAMPTGATSSPVRRPRSAAGNTEAASA